MKHSAFNLNQHDIDNLLLGYNTYGEKQTYIFIKEKITKLLSTNRSGLDSDLLDMSDTLLALARQDNIEQNNQKIYYILSSILRKLAHETRIQYIRMNKETHSEDERFLRLVYTK